MEPKIYHALKDVKNGYNRDACMISARDIH